MEKRIPLVEMYMENSSKMIAFGPVPSRRLGRSLGINNIPPKICTYSCIYCQLGRTLSMQVEREMFYKPEDIAREVKTKVEEARTRREPIDYLTFVPDGEPTLDINLGREIELLKGSGFKIAVISNASLIWREDVRDDLYKADWVSLKTEAVSEDIWRRINRPYRLLKLDEILLGIEVFSNSFKGELAIETMLIQDFNVNVEELKRIADFITGLKPTKSYISIPTRPPAERWIRSATENVINAAYQIFNERAIDTECLIGYEGNAFAFTGNVEEDLLSITSVHPMREDAVYEFLSKTNANWDTIERLIDEDKLREVEYEDKKFFLRKLRDPKSRKTYNEA